MTKILVTGAAGAAGSHMMEALLNAGYKVVGMDITAPYAANNIEHIIDKVDYKWQSSEDIDRDDLKDIGVIMDFAAQGDSPLGITSPFHTLKHNSFGLINLLEAVRRNKFKDPPLFLYPSSGTMFSEPLYLPIDEKHPPTPSHPYSTSKVIAEAIVQCYSRFADIPFVTFRNGIVYGPRMRRGMCISEWIYKVLHNKLLVCESPHATRDPTYNGDIIQPWLKVIDMWYSGEGDAIRNETLQISKCKEYSVLDLCKMTVEAAGVDPSSIVVGKNRAGEKLVG